MLKNAKRLNTRYEMLQEVKLFKVNNCIFLPFQVQHLPPSVRRRNEDPAADRPKVTLVVFVGGCTFAEISALRFLSQQEDANTEYLVATTSVVNGNSFLRNAIRTKSLNLLELQMKPD